MLVLEVINNLTRIVDCNPNARPIIREVEEDSSFARLDPIRRKLSYRVCDFAGIVNAGRPSVIQPTPNGRENTPSDIKCRAVKSNLTRIANVRTSSVPLVGGWGDVTALV